MIASTRYSCKFGNGAGGDRVIVVDLPPDEIERARGHVCPEIAAKAFALKRAYAQVPDGFRHHDVTPMWVN
jgi:hypothetical protein